MDEVVYSPELESPPDKPYRFIYFLTIHNDSTEAVTIRGRKWVVREADGEMLVLEGDGVVGEFPHLNPGESFSYNSSHITALDAVADGAVFGLTDNAMPVYARIPSFDLIVPE